ncbi:MAG: hypothetical protein ACQESR_30880 [Planctomycetota bacterium]
MESRPTQAVLPLVGLAAEKVIRDRYSLDRRTAARSSGKANGLAGSPRSADPGGSSPHIPPRRISLCPAAIAS